MNRGMDRVRTGNNFHKIWWLRRLVGLGACIAVAMCLAGCTGDGINGQKKVTISPNNGARKTTVRVKISAPNVLAGTTLTVSGTGITLAHMEVTLSDVADDGGLTGGTISADFIIAEGAELNGHTVTVVRPAPAASSTTTFTVLPVGTIPLAVTAIAPAEGIRGQSVPITVTGSGFLAGDIVAITGTGIAVTTDSVASDVIHAIFVIDATASIAPRTVTVVRASGIVSNGFEFDPKLPSGSGAAVGTLVFTSNLVTIPGGPVNAFPSVYTGRLSSSYSNLTNASVSMTPDAHPRWSPDRTAIVFIRSDSSTGSGRSVYLMDFNGANVRKVTPVGDHGEQFGRFSDWPSFHPDGRHILFTNGTEFSRMAIMDLDGSHARFLFPAANANFSITGPLYSPVGLKIVFSSTQDGPAHIFVIDDDGTNLQRLTNSGDADRHPGFTYPLGAFIFYERDHYDNAGTFTSNIYNMKFDGSENKAITTDDKSFDPGFLETGAITSTLVFVSNRSGTNEIYTISNQGGDASQQTTLNLSGAQINDPSAFPNPPATKAPSFHRQAFRAIGPSTSSR